MLPPEPTLQDDRPCARRGATPALEGPPWRSPSTSPGSWLRTRPTPGRSTPTCSASCRMPMSRWVSFGGSRSCRPSNRTASNCCWSPTSTLPPVRTRRPWRATGFRPPARGRSGHAGGKAAREGRPVPHRTGFAAVGSLPSSTRGNLIQLNHVHGESRLGKFGTARPGPIWGVNACAKMTRSMVLAWHGEYRPAGRAGSPMLFRHLDQRQRIESIIFS